MAGGNVQTEVSNPLYPQQERQGQDQTSSSDPQPQPQRLTPAIHRQSPSHVRSVLALAQGPVLPPSSAEGVVKPTIPSLSAAPAAPTPTADRTPSVSSHYRANAVMLDPSLGL